MHILDVPPECNGRGPSLALKRKRSPGASIAQGYHIKHGYKSGQFSSYCSCFFLLLNICGYDKLMTT